MHSCQMTAWRWMRKLWIAVTTLGTKIIMMQSIETRCAPNSRWLPLTTDAYYFRSPGKLWQLLTCFKDMGEHRSTATTVSASDFFAIICHFCKKMNMQELNDGMRQLHQLLLFVAVIASFQTSGKTKRSASPFSFTDTAEGCSSDFSLLATYCALAISHLL